MGRKQTYGTASGLAFASVAGPPQLPESALVLDLSRTLRRICHLAPVVVGVPVMRIDFQEEAENCRRQALEFSGKPEEPFLLRVASAFDELISTGTARSARRTTERRTQTALEHQ
jgi:hypothetical protein